jgi:hypothetical protein
VCLSDTVTVAFCPTLDGLDTLTRARLPAGPSAARTAADERRVSGDAAASRAPSRAAWISCISERAMTATSTIPRRTTSTRGSTSANSTTAEPRSALTPDSQLR